MKHFLQKILSCMFVCITCAFGAIDSANAVNFTVTTNSMCNGDRFYFTISASGNYTVSCEKGTLRSSNCSGSVSGSNINRSGNTTNCLYYCEFSKYSTFSNCNARTIDFTVNTTPSTYNTSAAAISFYAYGDISNTSDSQLSSNAAHIAGISGSLGQMFPYKGSSTNQHPIFKQTFRGASNLTSVSASIFNGYAGNLQGANSMFEQTFFGCTNLTSIDYNLFSNITGGGSGMFAETFYGCSKLNPSTPLRFQITSGQSEMFRKTFMGCTSLVNPPSFSNLSTGASYMFYQTFYGCSNLTSAPSSFFSSSNVSGQSSMFYGTFENCTKLQTLPSNLFSNITTAANNMFERTFYGCSGFNSNTYVPKTLFAGLTPRQSSYPTNMMQNIFGGSNNLATSCPSGMSQYGTGYESYWNSKVSCTTGFLITYSCGSNGSGTPTDSNGYASGATVTALTSSACTASNGYTFYGWGCGNGVGSVSSGGTFTMPSANVTCTAQYTAINYTVNFVAGTHGSGNTYYQTHHVGDTVTLPANSFTAANGYQFTGWNCNNNIGDKAVNETFTMPAAAVTCTAQWTANQTTVSYACGTGATGSAPSSGTATYGSNFIFAANNSCAKTGYRFDGWNCNGLTGVQAPNANLPSGYTQLNYIQSTGTQWIDTGFKFTGSTVRYDLIYNRLSNQSSVSLFGASNNDTNWSGIPYYSGTTSNRLAIGTNYNINITTESAGTLYTYSLFIDRNNNTWELTKNGTSSSGTFPGTITNTVNVALFAHNKDTTVWQQSSYKNYGFKITQDGTLVHNFVPAKNSNNVLGMYDTVGGTFKTNSGSGTFVAGNPEWTYTGSTLSCTANWAQVDYTVSFAAGSAGGNTPTGTTASFTNKHYGDTITLPANGFTAANGYKFTGWNCNNNIGDKAVNETFTMPASNVICTAQWMPVYTITYSCGSNGTGTPTDSNSPYIEGTTVTALTSSACTASGYTFNGWSCDNNVGSVSSGGTFTMPSANTTCTAQYTAINYTVSFVAGTHGSGSTYYQTNKHVGDTITLPANEFTPSSGYGFNGWNCNNNIGDKAVNETFTMPAAAVTCTAQWMPVYTVTYSCSNGTGAPTDSNSPYIGGATVAALTSSACTTLPGDHFNYWDCGSVGSVSSGGTFTMPSANVTCTAAWSYQLFNVSFAAGTHGSGSMSSYTSIRAREQITLPSNSFAVTNGYQFTGWNCNNNIGDKAVGETFSMPVADVTCTAQYTAIDYTVSFAAGTYGSGSMSSQTNKHVGDRITLPSNEFTPSSGYIFNGWSCDNNVGSRPAGGIFPMPAANTTCTAQWTGNTVNLTWYGEDGETTLSGGASSCTYGGTISSLPTAPEKPGYHFTKWKVK